MTSSPLAGDTRTPVDAERCRPVPQLNAVITPLYDKALAAARRAVLAGDFIEAFTSVVEAGRFQGSEK